MAPPNADERTHLMVQSDDQEDEYSSARTNRRASHAKLTVWNFVGIICFVATCVLLMAARRKDLSSMQDEPPSYSTRSKYKKVQGMGFQIYTGGAPAFLNTNGTKNLNPECVGRASYGQIVTEEAPQIQCYLGDDDAMKDVKKRLEIMKDAVEKAYKLADNDDPETLKIFIAPEFFWRGVNGAYMFVDEAPEDDEVCGPVCQILKGLEEIAAQQRFEDWLFVFGSVIASETLPTKDPYDYLFYNFAPIYKGYDPDKTGFRGKRFIVPKRYVSSSDFLTPQRHLNATMTKELIGQPLPQHDTTVFNPHDFSHKRYDNEMWNDYKKELDGLGYAMIEYDWAIIDGLAMTLEICLDHQMRSALTTYLADITTGQNTLIPSSSDNGLEYVRIPRYQAQISIVSSAGMYVSSDSLALTNNGTIFLQDGLNNATNRMFWSVDECEAGLQFEGGTEAVQRRAFLSATDIFFEYTALSNFQRNDIYDSDKWEDSIKGYFSTKLYPPQLTIFDAIDIAEVAL